MQKSLYELTQLSPREASDKYRRPGLPNHGERAATLEDLLEGQPHQDPVN